MLHIGIVWANPYGNNLGVAALAYSSLAILHDVCKEAGIAAKFSFVDHGQKGKDIVHIGNDEIQFSIIKMVNGSPMFAKLKMALKKKKYNGEAIKRFDAVFDISGGDSFTDIYGDKRFAGMISSKQLFNSLGTLQVLMPQTIGPFNKKEHEAAAFEAMKKMAFVFPRDKQSYDYSAKFLPAEKLYEAIDVAFYMPYKKKKFEEGKIHVGINVSGLLWNGGYTKNNQFDMKSDYKKLVEETIRFFVTQENVVVHLVSHVINRTKSIEDDYSVSEKIQRQYPDVILAPSFYSPFEAKGYISGLDFFTGARMHACIGAFSSGVPVYPMAYSRKFNGLFVNTLQYRWMGDCVNETNEVILQNLQAAFAERAEAKKVIENSNKQIVGDRLATLKKILSQHIKSIKPKQQAS